MTADGASTKIAEAARLLILEENDQPVEVVPALEYDYLNDVLVVWYACMFMSMNTM